MVQSESVHHLLSLRNMTVLSWLQGLEDEFDGKNRMNLRHFIRQKQTEITLDDGSSIDSAEVTYYITKKSSGLTIEHEKFGRELMEITRIPSCAIFHKIASGQGVPHTFTGEYGLMAPPLVCV